jgi:hypothetical protein
MNRVSDRKTERGRRIPYGPVIASTIKRRPGAQYGWTPYETEQPSVSMEIRADLSKNTGLCVARFSVLLFPHQDKERFVNTIERGATRYWLRTLATGGSGARR